MDPKEERLTRMRHSASHIMAEAVLSLFPEAKFAIGPAIENGFYYDFDLRSSLTPEDPAVIEQKMRDIVAPTRRSSTRRRRRTRREMFDDAAVQAGAHRRCRG
jgi:threonyl-tRNA synthetase